jgi:signal transduction histidine kinase
MTIQRALLWGICLILAVVALSQLLSLWWLQQQLQQEITKQSGQLSKIVLARTAEKIQLNTKVITLDDKNTAEPASAPDNTPTSTTDTSGNTTTTVTKRIITTSNGDEMAQEVRIFKVDSQQALPEVMQIELAETLQELDELHAIGNNGAAQPWVQRFNIDSASHSKAIIDKYLRYQLLALLVSLALALSLALWLGYRFIAPLQQLVQGFRRLASGEAPVQLDDSQGLAEYRFVLNQFNTASQQLTDLAAHRAQLAQQQQLIELGEISRGLVHALRNPIHTMALALEQMPAVSEQQQQLHKLIEQKMQHINRTLTALLTLSCDGVDRSEQVSLNAVLQDIALEFSQAKVQIQLALPATVLMAGAEAELRTIAHAVICNAVEASPERGVVKVHLQKFDDRIELMVSDQGAGLSNDIIAQLFQPHISSKAEGAGMGLYLCRRLLQRYYHGDITINNLSGNHLTEPANDNAVGGCMAKITFGVQA